jgi:hypothetical protein
MSDPTIQTPNCVYCGAVPSPGESFCRNCGRPLAGPTNPAADTQYSTTTTAPAATAAVTTPLAGPVLSGRPIKVGRKPRSRLLMGCLIVLGLALVALGAGGIYVWRRTVYTSPQRTAPALPERAAATITEFPVDNDSTAPAIPVSLQTEALGGTTPTKSEFEIPIKLPPGITRTALAKGASSMTSAAFQTRRETQPVSSSEVGTVYLYVLTLLPARELLTDELADMIQEQIGGEKTDVKVESSTGFVYVGSKIHSADSNAYVLNKQGADMLILLYAQDSDATVIDRLAQNVGNGQGLFDYQEVKNSLWTFPASVPPSLALTELSTQNQRQIEKSLIAGQKDADGEKIITQIRWLIPARLTSTEYVDSDHQIWVARNFEYKSTFHAWRNWTLTRVWLRLAGAKSITVSDVSGLYLSQQGMSMLVFQKGPYIIALTGPRATTSDGLVRLGNLFQL